MARRFYSLLLAATTSALGLTVRADAPQADLDNPHYRQAQQDLDNNDANAAADEYEAALVSDPKLADAHYELGVLYAEKLSEPISALYHLDRFLKLAPNSSNAAAARDLVTTESEAFAASLPGSSSSAALARLQIENTGLKKQAADAGHTIEELQGELAQANAHAATTPMEPATGVPPPTGPAPAGGVVAGAPGSVMPAPTAASLGGTNALASAAVPDASGGRTYTVIKGDKIWTIAKRMYPGHTKEGVQKIQEANKDALGNRPLKIGQVLLIPEL